MDVVTARALTLSQMHVGMCFKPSHNPEEYAQERKTNNWLNNVSGM